MTDQLSGGVVQPTDAQILALNAGEKYFSESPSRYPEAGFGTQYHTGAPGVIGFARAVLALAVPQAPLQAEPVPVVASEVLKELIAASDEQDSWRMSHPALRQHLSTEEAHRIGDRVDKAWIAARRVAVLATPQAETAVAEQARNAEDFLDLGLADVQDESGLLRYYSRDAVLECIEAALASQSTPPPESAGQGLSDAVALQRINEVLSEYRAPVDGWMSRTDSLVERARAILAANPTAKPDGGSKA